LGEGLAVATLAEPLQKEFLIAALHANSSTHPSVSILTEPQNARLFYRGPGMLRPLEVSGRKFENRTGKSCSRTLDCHFVLGAALDNGSRYSASFKSGNK
jgi:hypothetical protein